MVTTAMRLTGELSSPVGPFIPTRPAGRAGAPFHFIDSPGRPGRIVTRHSARGAEAPSDGVLRGVGCGFRQEFEGHRSAVG